MIMDIDIGVCVHTVSADLIPSQEIAGHRFQQSRHARSPGSLQDRRHVLQHCFPSSLILHKYGMLYAGTQRKFRQHLDF